MLRRKRQPFQQQLQGFANQVLLIRDIKGLYTINLSNTHGIFQTLNDYLDITAAQKACRNFGNDWKVDHTTDRALICTKGTSWLSNCDSCSSWRMLVWEDGGYEYNKGTQQGLYQTDDPSTVAGKFYGGHEPCEIGNNYPLCGDWISTGNIPFIVFKLSDTIIKRTEYWSEGCISYYFLQLQQKNQQQKRHL